MEQFIDFLIREGCAGKFFHNFQQEAKYPSFSKYFDDVPNDDKRWLVNSAFTWAKTPEEQNYWESIEQKWQNTLEGKIAFDRWWNESGIVDEYNDGLRDIALAAWNAAKNNSK